MNHSQIVSFLWGIADIIRDTFKRRKIQDVTLPLTVTLKGRGREKDEGGDFYVRSGPGSVRLEAADVEAYVKTRFPALTKDVEQKTS